MPPVSSTTYWLAKFYCKVVYSQNINEQYAFEVKRPKFFLTIF